jgi:hypothetical protein
MTCSTIALRSVLGLVTVAEFAAVEQKTNRAKEKFLGVRIASRRVILVIVIPIMHARSASSQQAGYNSIEVFTGENVRLLRDSLLYDLLGGQSGGNAP